MTKQSPLIRIAMAVYFVMFFTYLLGPLVLMSITAFNSSEFPRVAPWDVFTFEWFRVLFNDDVILFGLLNSFRIGIFTIILSVSMGLAGALVMTQIWPKLRATYYTVLIAPILIPGVVLGISTLVFWGRINTYLGLSSNSIFQNGIFLTVLGQSTFIASYCMLVFIARLQRYDSGLTEAALDLGATHLQAFRKIQLPFLYPAIGSASVLALLASFENYNTTTFTFLNYPTLTIALAQKVRLGINPSISALAFIIVCLTVFFALVHEVRTRRAQLAIANGAPVGAVRGGFQMPRFLAANPAAIMLSLFVIAAAGMVVFAQFYDPEPAKKILREKKQAEQQKRIKAVQERMRLQRLQQKMKGPDIFAPKKGTGAGKTPFGNVFDPNNLKAVGGKGSSPAPARPKTPFGSIFDPNNLNKVGGASGDREKPTKGSSPQGAFGNVFAPKNLEQAGPKK
ncbi:MAG TPA: ABC transporter permease [Devosia sp.]|nr:ABC transporter permease [Devosia sp.]